MVWTPIVYEFTRSKTKLGIVVIASLRTRVTVFVKPPQVAGVVAITKSGKAA